MEFKIKSSVYNEEVFSRTFSRDFRDDTFKEETMILDKENIKGTIRLIQLNGFCLIIKEIKIPSAYSVRISAKESIFKLHFEMEGAYNYTPKKPSAHAMDIPNGKFNILYFSNIEGILNYKAGSRKTMEVLFTEDFLLKAAGEDYNETLKDLSNRIKKGKNFMYWEKSRPIPFELQQNIQELISCRYCGHIKKIYLEARITALLLNLLVRTNSETSIDETREFSKTEYSGIQKVEEYIKMNFSKTITIAELAPIAGINTSKLKQSFKKIYGTTIFKYITGLRMERAAGLIKYEKLSVSEASYRVGYKNPQHFTVAFKKYYGYLPSSLCGLK